MTTLRIVKPSSEAEKNTRTTTDTIEVTPSLVKAWRRPAFQRPLKVNDKVREVAVEIKQTLVIPGYLTLGVLDKVTYLLDGQHRIEAFTIAEIPLAYADIRVTHYESMADMAEEFRKLNSRIVTMKPDDLLRAMESSYQPLARFRRKCSFIGYDNIRRGPSNPILSMSTALRCWFGSAPEVPTGAGVNAADTAKKMTADDADAMATFYDLCINAWGRDPEYSRLWLNLNLITCAWLYRRLVVTPYSTKTQQLTKEQFGALLRGLSADENYISWLTNRQMNNVHRGPCYGRVKAIFARQIETDTGKRPLLPAPAWAANNRGAGGGVS